MVVGNNESTGRIAGNFDCHTDAEVRHKAYRLIEHNQGVTLSHCMPPSGKCLRRNTPAVVMVDEFV